MLDWLSRHADVLDLVISLCTLAVWIVYAQILVAGFRRRRLPSLIINRGRGAGPDVACVVGNMSEETVFVQYVIAALECDAGTITIDATAREPELTA